MLYNIETRKFAFTSQFFQGLKATPHIHTHLELIFIKSGHSIATLDNQQFHLKAGDIFLAFPNQLHFYHDIEPTEGYLIIFAPEILPEFKELYQSKIPETPVWDAKILPLAVLDCFQKITERLETNSPIGQVAAKGYLLTLFAEMLVQKKLCDKPGDEDTIKRILTYCLEHYVEPLTLESLAKELYLNKYYISHIFRDRMHISYKEFITQLRLEHACKLLKKNVSITETSYASGFSSVKTFNRVFLKYMKMAPRDYAKKD